MSQSFEFGVNREQETSVCEWFGLPRREQSRTD